MTLFSGFILAAIATIISAGVHIALPFFLRNALAKAFLRKKVRGDKIYLTFDDGPDPVSTPKILDALRDHGAKATFFVIGEAAKKHPQIVERIVAEGHSVGNHSYQHRHAWKCFPWTSLQDVRKGQVALKSLGLASSLWRPPYGKASLPTLIHALSKGLQLVYWTKDPRDYEPSNTVSALSEWLSEQTTPGSIILLHDGRRTQPGSSNITPDGLKAFLSQTSTPATQFVAL